MIVLAAVLKLNRGSGVRLYGGGRRILSGGEEEVGISISPKDGKGRD